jgi:hypothetical protein
MIKKIFYEAVFLVLLWFLWLIWTIPVINYINSVQQESLEQEVIDNQESHESNKNFQFVWKVI